MLSIITSYFIQTGKCALPYIGFFHIEYKPAVSDNINRQILPPAEEIVFTEESVLLSPGLVKYIALKKNIAESDAAGLLDNFCKESRQQIDAGDKLCLETLGCLQKNEFGGISFLKENHSPYFQNVHAERVLHPGAGHDVLVGDTQTTSAAMNKYYSKEPVAEKRRWQIWALILFVFTLVVLLYSFYNHKFSPLNTGNRNHFIIDSAGETHFQISR